MSDCPLGSLMRSDKFMGGTAAGKCNDCWAAIFDQIRQRPAEKILPRPSFCQDAAFVAFMFDAMLDNLLAMTDALTRRLKEVDELKDLLSEARGGEPQRIAEIFDQARQEADDGETRP